MKLACLTWWRNNYGSILQAYALQEAFKDYDDVSYEIICQYGSKIASFSNFKDKVKEIGLLKSIKRVICKFGLKKLRLRTEKLQKFVDENLSVSKRQYDSEHISEANDVYDGFVCGSDQIWNPQLSPVTSMYWLSFAEKNKYKIAYAPSIGVSEVTDEQSKKIRENLSDFVAISCREESGTKLINNILKSDKCTNVLDPTLLVERKVWDNICPANLFNEHYIFAYILRGNKKQRKLIERFAKEKNLKIVTIPFLDTEKIELYDFSFGDIKFWDASPVEFISAIRNADYIFTDSFHCMVFSCLYHKEFFTFPKIGPAQMSRITDLQKLFGMSSRFINEQSSINDINNMEKIDWNLVDKTIAEKRLLSRQYLDKAINSIKIN